MIGPIDYIVIIVYLLFMVALGPIYRKFNSTASDYFRGGGGMLWWMVGASSFMITFSAWTFTGAAGKAYEMGTFVLLLFTANAVGLLFSIFLTAHRYRQMRIITPVEAIRNRFGSSNEQFFTWLPIPMFTLMGGIGMYAIGIFMASVFKIDLWLVIVGLGVVVTIMAALGGAAAVVSSDFMQFMTIIVVSLVMMARTFAHPEVGGVSGMVEQLPAAHTDWTELMRPEIIVIFAVTLFFNQLVQGNSVWNGAARYVFVKTGRDARKAALVAFLGFIFFPAIWLIPAMSATMLHPELGVIKDIRPTVLAVEEARASQLPDTADAGDAQVKDMSDALAGAQAHLAQLQSTHTQAQAQAAADPAQADAAKAAAKDIEAVELAIPRIAEAQEMGVERDNIYFELKNANEAAYVATALTVLPTGMMGLLVCAIFAATMSSMDSGLNRSAGIVVRNCYLPLINPEASETRQIAIGKLLTVLLGTIMTVSGLFFSTLQTLPLFELILLLAALIGLPISIPLFFGIFVKRVPAWAAWSTVLFGILIGGLANTFLTPDHVAAALGYVDALSGVESSNLLIGITTAVNLIGCTLWFFGTMLFWKHSREPYKQQVEEFFETMHTPVDVVAEKVPGWETDRMHYQVLGFMCMAYGGLICLLALLPNDASGRLAFLFCGGVIGALGVIFFLISKRSPKAGGLEVQTPDAVEAMESVETVCVESE